MAEPRYLKRNLVRDIGTVQITPPLPIPKKPRFDEPPLPIPKKPRFDEAFYIFGECIKKRGLLRVAQHTILPK
jgi:hypothetical protein